MYRKFSCILLAAMIAMPSFAVTPVLQRVLNKTNANKKEVRHSMIGFRNTLIFYTFADSKAVLRLMIDNKDTSFPVKGTVFLFDESVTADGLGKWLNNQHSDGLYPEVPEPKVSAVLPDGVAKVIENKFVAERENHFDKAQYREFEVKVEVKEHISANKFKLLGFTDSAKVTVKPKK